jgi:photosystem II stability/assembly factor-like uncharacterized protein
MKKLSVFSIACLFFIFTSANKAQWTQVSGSYGNITKCFITVGDTIFAGTDGEGIYRSGDYGLNWNSANTGLENVYIRAFVVNGDNIFAGSWLGIFLSTDGGSNWSPAYNGMDHKEIQALQ